MPAGCSTAAVPSSNPPSWPPTSPCAPRNHICSTSRPGHAGPVCHSTGSNAARVSSIASAWYPCRTEGPRCVRVKGVVLAAHQPPQHRKPEPQRLHRIPDADHLDRHLVVAAPGAEGRRGVGAHLVLVVPVGFAHIPLGRVLGAQQAHPVDHAGKRPDCVGAARVAEEEDPVAGAVARGKHAVGAADLPVDAPALDHVAEADPRVPLDPRLVVERQIGGRRQLVQELVEQADVRLALRFQRRHRPVEKDDVADRTAAARRARLLGARGTAEEAPYEVTRPQSHPC